MKRIVLGFSYVLLVTMIAAAVAYADPEPGPRPARAEAVHLALSGLT